MLTKKPPIKPVLNPKQRGHLDAVMDSLRQQHPGVPDKDLVAKYVIPGLLGPGAKWNRNGHQIMEGAAYNAGAFCIFWGKDPDTGRSITLLHQRKEKDRHGKPLFGAPGGYIEAGEITTEGLKREVEQELRYANKKPVIELDENRLVLIQESKRYPDKKSLQVTMYSYELTPGEIKTLKAYERKFSKGRYAQHIAQKTEGETTGIVMAPLSHVVQELDGTNFTYPLHYYGFCETARRYLWDSVDKPSSSRQGYTQGDSKPVEPRRYFRGDKSGNPKWER